MLRQRSNDQLVTFKFPLLSAVNVNTVAERPFTEVVASNFCSSVKSVWFVVTI